jgi:hypothetical protein
LAHPVRYRTIVEEVVVRGAAGEKGTADRPLGGVLVVWVLCVLAQVICIQKYGISLLYCDEWAWTQPAVGKVPLT